MKTVTEICLVALLTTSLLPAFVYGDEVLSRDEAEKLIKGNTAEGTNKWGKKMIWFFDDFGHLKKLDDRGQKGKAKWSLDEKGRLCYQDKHMNREVCQPIIPVDGGFEVPFDAEWKWEKVVPGNPHDL